jgi:hypothetical protein
MEMRKYMKTEENMKMVSHAKLRRPMGMKKQEGLMPI